MNIYNTRLNQTELTHEQLATIESQTQEKHLLCLDFDTRQRSRFKALTESNIAVGIDLPRTETLKNGCVLSDSTGNVIQIMAAKQALICVTADDGFDLMKGAYHLGNRHVPLMITKNALYFEPDHVLESMLQNLGLHTKQVQAPFEPETGAYKGSSGKHSHSQTHTHHHANDHSHDPASHSHNHSNDHDHQHSHSHD